MCNKSKCYQNNTIHKQNIATQFKKKINHLHIKNSDFNDKLYSEIKCLCVPGQAHKGDKYLINIMISCNSTVSGTAPPPQINKILHLFMKLPTQLVSCDMDFWYSDITDLTFMTIFVNW